MRGLEGTYDFDGGKLKMQGGDLTLELKYRRDISKAPQKFLVRELSSGKVYVSGLFPERGGYIINDRKQTYVVSTGSTWVSIKKRK